MTISEMKEKRVALTVEATKLVKAEMNAETRAKIDAIYADADALKGDIERSERAEAMEAELRERTPNQGGSFVEQNPKQVAEGEEVDPLVARIKSPEYKAAYKKFLRTGERNLTQSEVRTLRGAEVRTQSSASNASGGYIVPIDLADQIEVALKFFGGMRQVASNIKTAGGGVLNWPTNNDTANVGAILSGSAPEQDLTFGVQPFSAYTYTTKQIPVQNELLEDSAFDLDAFIREAFVNRIGRIQNTHFTTGSGTGQPNGLLTASTAGVTAATGGTVILTYNNFVDTVHSVDVAYRSSAKFMFHDTTLQAARKIVDTLGRPLLGLGLNGGDPDSILGYKFVVNNDMPVLAANAKTILFGDLSKYLIRDVANSLAIMRLSELGALSNQTIFVGFVRGDGQLIDAGTHPSTYFSQSAT